MISRLSLFYAARYLSSARALFIAALGVEFVQQRHLEELTCWSATLPGGAVLELRPATFTQPSSRVQLEFEVENLNAAAEALTTAGFKVRQLAGGVLVTDPSRNTIALIQRR
ncbi:VOC family protein [Mycolicibacterium llatzerense]|uniref:VOC family protein n=1 Tax=Mycolicibacterium llatzerense TaxID=280871 RepID=UPI0008DE1219|nr:hypothetical protein [Mycolicibacterium llatzerense]